MSVFMGPKIDGSCVCGGGGGGGIAGIDVQDEGVSLPSNPTTILNFVGAGVTATSGGAGTTIVTIPGSVVGAKTLTYTLLDNQINVTSTGYTTVAFFPWLNSRYNSYINGIVVFRVVLVNRNLDIRLVDTTASVVLGSASLIAPTTLSTTFIIINPSADATVELQVRKNALGGINPAILGCVMEFNA